MNILCVRRCQCPNGAGIFKRTIGKESLYEISNDNGVRVVHFATSKNLSVKEYNVPTS
jgi:hypothetical protein